MNEEIEFCEDWYNVKNYELKILILTSMLAENNLGYRGTLKTMCEWLGVQSCAPNNSKIRCALDNLVNDEYIFLQIEGRTFHISIRDKGYKDRRIVKIRKKWIETIKAYNKNEENKRKDKNISVDWLSMLKVFVFIYGMERVTVIKREDIAKRLNISVDTVSSAVKGLIDCKFDGIAFCREIIRDKIKTESETRYITQGSEYKIMLVFE